MWMQYFEARYEGQMASDSDASAGFTPLEAGRRGLNVVTLDPDTQQVVVGVALIV